jgi:hypothetical protein
MVLELSEETLSNNTLSCLSAANFTLAPNEPFFHIGLGHPQKH